MAQPSQFSATVQVHSSDDESGDDRDSQHKRLLTSQPRDVTNQYGTWDEQLLPSRGHRPDFLSERLMCKTVKFWVLPSNMNSVKNRVKRMDTDEQKRSSEASIPPTWLNSIYFETDDLTLYNQRMQLDGDSTSFRYTWTSGKRATRGYFQMKQRKREWREAHKTTKFDVDSHLVLSYLREGPDALSHPTPASDTIYRQLAPFDNRLKPCIRATFRRSHFSGFDSTNIRVFLDESIQLSDVKYSEWENATDPQRNVPASKVFHFPLGVLEVRMQYESEEDLPSLELPHWIQEMQSSGMIIRVQRFSKFCTGAVIMNLYAIQRVPSWMAAVKTLMEIELARAGKEGFAQDKNWEIIAEDQAQMPRRIEPRAFLANERTLLKWVRMCFLAIFVGLALLGFEHEPVTGVILTGFALILMFRAYYMYQKRLRMIVAQEYIEGFHDAWGPPLIMLAFVVPGCTYLILKLLK